MAESLPPSDHCYATRRNTRKRSLDADEARREPRTELVQELREGEVGPSEPGSIDCAVCLQSCVHPARLPCGHIFCFLCLKGVYRASAKCAMCRQAIPHNYFDSPDIIENAATAERPSAEDGAAEEFKWFYEGRHGWWEYDRRTKDDLEAALKASQADIELLIAGCVYVVDFTAMVQYQKTDPTRRRAVKRDKVGTVCKGVAGIRPTPHQTEERSSGNRPRTTLFQRDSTAYQTEFESEFVPYFLGSQHDEFDDLVDDEDSYD